MMLFLLSWNSHASVGKGLRRSSPAEKMASRETMNVTCVRSLGESLAKPEPKPSFLNQPTRPCLWEQLCRAAGERSLCFRATEAGDRAGRMAGREIGKVDRPVTHRQQWPQQKGERNWRERPMALRRHPAIGAPFCAQYLMHLGVIGLQVDIL